MKRIGDILIASGWIEPSILQRALVKQKQTGHRLCSLLVLGGALGADEAACALGEQHGVAAALQRHLTRRDRTLASLLSPALARACIALPLGRMGNGDVIVCVRDPSPALETQLGRAMKETIRLAVAPAHQLEALVLETYGPDDANEFDVDLNTGPIMSLELEDDAPVEPRSDEALADLGSLELVDLDDTGVAKDESQSQLPIGNQRTSTLPPTSVAADAPSHRSSTAIVVDAPSQREPPGRAALSAAGIAVARTQTPRSGPVRETADDAGIAIPRTQTPMTSGLDAAGAAAAPRDQAPPGRAALATAGPTVARTQTPRSLHEEAAVPRTRTPQGGSIHQEIAAARTRTPGRSSLDAAAARAVDAVAAAEAAAAAEAVAAFELSPDDEAPAVITSRPVEPPPVDPAPGETPAPRTPPKTLVPTSVTRMPATPTPTPTPSVATPPIAPPRAEGVRPPPAALAALQRASSSASRVPNIPPRPIPSALPSRPIPVPAPVARAPEEIALGTQLPTATLAISPRLSEALAALNAAPTIDLVCDALMAFGAKRWSATLLLEIDGIAATGRRGHGAQISDDLAQWIVMSLQEPSLLQAAFAFPEVATKTPDGHGDVEIRLQQLLGRPRAPSAIALSVEGKPLMMLAVGDPDGDDMRTAAADLARLGDGAAAALTRLRSR